jgi:hypothetical protein
MPIFMVLLPNLVRDNITRRETAGDAPRRT